MAVFPGGRLSPSLGWNRFIWASSCPVAAVRALNPCDRPPVVGGVRYMRQTWSRALAFSTRSFKVFGCGCIAIIFSWSAIGMFFLKANIFVFSSTPDREAWVDHSWYQLLNILPPIRRLCMAWTACNWDCVGTKWVSYPFLKSCHDPKSIRFAVNATFCLSRAHSLAGVPTLKYVRVVAIFLLSSANMPLLR